MTHGSCLIVSALALSGLLAACSPKPPPAPPPPATASVTAKDSGAVYTVKADPAGPKSWTYEISANRAAGPVLFGEAQLHSDGDISRCTGALTTSEPASQAVITPVDANDLLFSFKPHSAGAALGWSSAKVTLSCEGKAAPVQVMIRDLSGSAAENLTLGPVAGPSGAQ